MKSFVVPIAQPARAATIPRNHNAGLAAICLGFLMITLDATIVNVALGPIVSSLGGSLSAAQWIVNGYTLAFAALLLSAGALADRVGTRGGYLIGLAIFGLGSAVCCVAESLPTLIAARVVQGAGAAWLMPCSLALITHSFPEGQARRRALAIWGGASGVGLASGPILGGVLTSAISWRAIFLVNVPVAIVAAWLLVRHVSETRRHRHPLDLAGQSLAVIALSLLTAGLIVAGQHGWLSGITLVLLVVGFTATVAFTLVERTVNHPMVDPALFQRRTFSLSVGIGVIFNFTLYGGLFCLALDLHDVHGLNPFQTGLAMLPVTLVTRHHRVLEQPGDRTIRRMAGDDGRPHDGRDRRRPGRGQRDAWRDVTARDQHDPARVDRDGDAGDDRHGNGRRARGTRRVGFRCAERRPSDRWRVRYRRARRTAARQRPHRDAHRRRRDRRRVRDWRRVRSQWTPRPQPSRRPDHDPRSPVMTDALPTPTLTRVYRLEATLGDPLDLGQIPQGQRRIVPLTGGTFTGPQLGGQLLSGASADWQVILADGTALGDIRYTLRTDDGDLLYVQSRGIRHGSAEVLARLGRGEPVDPSEYTFRTTTQIETTAPRLDWLNKGVFISVAGRQPAGVIYEVYLVA